jgi:FkbM family methyltransferase
MVKLRKIIYKKGALLMLLLMLLLGLILKMTIFKNIEYFTIMTDSELNANIASVKNPYIKDNNVEIIWQNENEFMKENFPSMFNFDYDIKEDIIVKALQLPQNSAIIDCGAHIGDGAVPIAHALKYNNRQDIIVYAIEPSKYKCNFIEYIKKKNGLDNLKVLNYGLSNVNQNYKTDMQTGDNTGGWNWAKSNEINENIDDNQMRINQFIKLDDLVKNKIIKEPIGVIHFDIEGMEKDALSGGTETISKYKPYMSIENNLGSGKDKDGNDNNKNTDYYLEFLPQGYKYVYNKGDNNVLVYNII